MKEEFNVDSKSWVISLI